VSPDVLLNTVTLKIVYNNYVSGKGVSADWGFACVIEGAQHAVLFDTGAKGPVLMQNLARLGIDPASIGSVVISHDHWDHTGGLSDLLRADPNVTVYLLDSFSTVLKDAVTAAGARLVAMERRRRIVPGIWTTGQQGSAIPEQAVFCATSAGLVVVTGCAHPGVVSMVRAARGAAVDLGLTRTDVALVTGGFHMHRMNDAQRLGIIEELRSLHVRRIGPSHCSGDRTRELFRQTFAEHYVDGDLGSVATVGAYP